jgi:hypothetical protein
VAKATMLVGICRLMELSMRKDGVKPLNQLTVDDLEEIAIKLHGKMEKKKRFMDQLSELEAKRVHSPNLKSSMRSGSR